MEETQTPNVAKNPKHVKPLNTFGPIVAFAFDGFKTREIKPGHCL
jgi:hypothetical protein